MSNLPPPLPSGREQKDIEHLQLVAIFHFVIAGLSGLGVPLLFLYYAMMKAVFNDPHLRASGQTPPAEVVTLLFWFFIVAGTILLIVCTLNVLSGLFIRQRRHLLFSMIVSGIDCLQVPFGTAVGIFSFIVFSRDFVRTLYLRSE
jgi:hypothetical protein